ncbi:MAG: hypothetical protein KAS38_15940 [Anaerolineales bacterium]|nr:hypothetical protein [Anaerolineales bacterium]
MKTNAMRILEKAEVHFIVKEHSRPVFTSVEAAHEREVKLSQIVKALVVMTLEGEIIVALIPGDCELDLTKMSKIIGSKKVALVSRDEVKRLTGYKTGAVSPIGMRRRLPIIMDERILDEEFVDISSGQPDAGIELRSKDLLDLTKAILARICK